MTWQIDDVAVRLCLMAGNATVLFSLNQITLGFVLCSVQETSCCLLLHFFFFYKELVIDYI